VKFQVRREDALSIPLTPLIDVVFLLLLFFMLTATFSEFQAFDVQLPVAGAETAHRETRIDVAVDDRGNYYLGGEAVTPEALHNGVKAAVDSNSEAVVYVHAHAQASHQAVVGAMAEVRLAVVHRLRLATLAPR